MKYAYGRLLMVIAVMLAGAGVAGATPVSFVGSHDFFDTGIGGTDGLGLSPDEAHLYVAAGSTDHIGIYARDGLTGALTLTAVVPQPPAPFSVSGVKVSADGKHVYAIGEGNLSLFDRDTGSGAITFVTSYGPGTVPALASADDLIISSDDAHLYVVSAGTNAVVGFVRNAVTGELTHIGQVVNGSGGVDGIGGVVKATLSPDGAHVYTAAVVDAAVAAFSRDGGTGVLTFVEAYFDGLAGVDGLGDAWDVVVSPDGQHVYVAGEMGVAVFSRNAGTGELTFVEADTEGNPASSRGVAVSPDGSHVYLVMAGAKKLRIYDRDTGTGEVTLAQEVVEGEAGIPETGSFRVITSADGEYIYTTAEQAVFRHTAVSCSATPLGGCAQPTQPGAAKLLLKDDPLLDQKDKLVWKFLKGPATTEGDFGDPAGTLNDYALCVYDGSVSGVFLEAVIPAGGGCGKAADHGGVACWSAVPGKGFKYKRKDTQPHGILAAKLFAGPAGKTKLVVKGKKDILPLGSGTPALPVTVQLQNRAGECWEAVYSTALANDGVVFKANSD